VATPTLDRVADILKYIDAHFTENVTLINLSERFYLSEFYLCRLFKEYTGRTVLGYITSLRVNRAKALLDTTDMPISKIARSSGFGSISAFGAAFRARLGCSPREWRKRGRGKEQRP
jgi:AraC-like DNA-binding protein